MEMFFLEYHYTVYRQLTQCTTGAWVIAYDEPVCPVFWDKEQLQEAVRAFIPEEVLDETPLTKAQEQRMENRYKIILPLLEDERCLADGKLRGQYIEKAAEEAAISTRTVRRYYYAYLAGGKRGLLRAQSHPVRAEGIHTANIAKGLNRFYYSMKKFSLQTAYELTLQEFYRNEDGELMDEYPTYGQFYYYYKCHKNHSRLIISRDGMGTYQRNSRPLTGGKMEEQYIGVYEMDATEADVNLVSRYDKKFIGRPYIYLAVDKATRLIAGLYVGFDNTASAVLQCLANAAEDKVDYCARYGIEISAEDWPSSGLPCKIRTDRGRDLMSGRVKDLCATFGMEISYLPPYRPDLKGSVEKAFDCIQHRYKPILRGSGTIDNDSVERGLPSYAYDARLTLDEFTKIMISCVLYYNSALVIKSYTQPAEMTGHDVRPVASDLWAWYAAKGDAYDRRILADPLTLHLMLLPRADAKMSRRGIEFNGLFYHAADIHHAMVQAAVEGKRKITIAFNPNDNSTVYWFLDGAYIMFRISPALKPLEGMSHTEATHVATSAKQAKKKAKKSVWRKPSH